MLCYLYISFHLKLEEIYTNHAHINSLKQGRRYDLNSKQNFNVHKKNRNLEKYMFLMSLYICIFDIYLNPFIYVFRISMLVSPFL